MKTYGNVQLWLHPFFILALDGGEWPASCLRNFMPTKRASGTRWNGPQASLYAWDKRKSLAPAWNLTIMTLVIQHASQSLPTILINTKYHDLLLCIHSF